MVLGVLGGISSLDVLGTLFRKALRNIWWECGVCLDIVDKIGEVISDLPFQLMKFSRV